MFKREKAARRYIEKGMLSGIYYLYCHFGRRFCLTNAAYDDLRDFIVWESNHHTRKERPDFRGVLCRAVAILDKSPTMGKPSTLAHGLMVCEWQHPRMNVYYMHECGHILIIRIENMKEVV